MCPFIKRKPRDTWKSHVLRGVRWIRAAQNCASRIPPVSVAGSTVWHTVTLKPMGAPLISEALHQQNWRRDCLPSKGSSWRNSESRLEMAKRGLGLPSFGFGVGAVAVNTCPSTDESLFCQFSRAFQVFTSILTILLVLYIVYIFGRAYFGSKKSGRYF
jgi:hypothetical protein